MNLLPPAIADLSDDEVVALYRVGVGVVSVAVSVTVSVTESVEVTESVTARRPGAAPARRSAVGSG